MEQIKNFLKFAWRAWKKLFRVLWIVLPFFALQYVLLDFNKEVARAASLWILIGLLLGLYIPFIPNLLKNE